MVLECSANWLTMVRFSSHLLESTVFSRYPQSSYEHKPAQVPPCRRDSFLSCLKELCPLQSLKACLSPSRCCSPRRIYKNYFFLSKAVIMVLLLNTLFSAAIYGVTSEILKLVFGAKQELTRNLVLHGAMQVAFPVAGHVADTYAGRHKAIRFSLWSAWVGFAVLCVSLANDRFDNHIDFLNRWLFLPATFLVIGTAYVCFLATVIPFGMDQLQGASHVHFRSFFHWWYWTVVLGSFLGNVPQYCEKSAHASVELNIVAQTGIGTLCMTAALILDALFSHWFVIEPRNTTRSNPLKQIASIVVHVASPAPTKMQRIPSVVRHELNEGRVSRLDLAKRRYGGKYETEEVENVRTFFRMIAVLFALGFPVFSYAGVYSTVGLMGARMVGSLPDPHFETFAGVCGDVHLNITELASNGFLILFIPLMDLVIVPFLGNFNPSIRKRMGIGAIMAFLGLLSLFLMEATRKYTSNQVCMFSEHVSNSQLNISIYWVFFPILLKTLAQIFIYIPSFEFISAQSPYNMQGLLIGLFFSIQGIFYLLSAILQYVFSTRKVYTYLFIEETSFSCGFWYYCIAVTLSLFGLVLFTILACRYKKRQREDWIVNEITLIEDYFVPTV